MNQERDNQRLDKLQVVLGIYNPATTFLGLLGGFVYTSIVTISLNAAAQERKWLLTLLLFIFSCLLATFHFWQLGALDFTRLAADSALIEWGNGFFFLGNVLLLFSLFWLVAIPCGITCCNIAWLILSLSELVFVGFKLKSILARPQQEKV